MNSLMVPTRPQNPAKLRLRQLAASAAVATLLPLSALAQTADCTLVGGVLPQECEQSNSGTVVNMPGSGLENTSAPAETGDMGFAITIEAAQPDQQVASNGSGGELRQVDRILEQAGVQVSYDGLGVKPVLSVKTNDLRSSYVAGSNVTFRASTNYPAWISRAEIRILDASRPADAVAVLPVDPNGSAEWIMPADGADTMKYVLRVYDASGRSDETQMQSLDRSARAADSTAKDGRIVAAGEGLDMTARRNIPVRGGAVSVSGSAAAGNSVTVMGQKVIADPSGQFAVQRILLPGVHDIRVGVGAGSVNRQVEVPNAEWFYVGLADATFGSQNGGETYALGRLAGYAKGHTAGGVTVTASVDTREGELKDIFNNLDEKNPSRVLRRVAPEGAYGTYGDQSSIVEDAPTSGKIYLKVEDDSTSALWGDFKVDSGSAELTRNQRTLYGAQVKHETLATTSEGNARLSASAYAAQPDRLLQRDTLRGTGGSAYFLKRQDILPGTETLLVQWRDPVSGTVIKSQRLTAGTDYELNYFQGVVVLRKPLGASSGTGAVSDRALGDYDVNLVAQYEYVPTTGDVDGFSAGARVEGWVNDNVRVGVSGQSEATGLVDNTLAGADVLIRKSDNSYLLMDYAVSEGPGFGSQISQNGGLDLTDQNTTGASGTAAQAVRVEGKADLAEMTSGSIKGEVGAYFDRKDQGFSSSDYDIAVDQTDWGVNGKVAITERADLKLGYKSFEDADAKRQNDTTVGLGYSLSDHLLLDLGLTQTDRNYPAAIAAKSGTRLDAGAKLTWTRDEDLKIWVLAQTTLEKSGGLGQNDRFGLGTSIRLSERVTAETEVSTGTLGEAAQAGLVYDNQAGTTYNLGYRLDPTRAAESSAFSGKDGGTWVAGATSKINDQVTYRAENTYDFAGKTPSVIQTYGVTYSPNDLWTYDGGIDLGESESDAGVKTKRRALAFGAAYKNGDISSAGVRGEVRREESSDGVADRSTYLASAYSEWKANESDVMIAKLDTVFSESDQSNLRNGEYVEGKLSYAYRPIAHDRLTALLSFTHLRDLPGVDQVNIDGNVNGPSQRSNIISADVNYDLTKQLTLGAKYGYRLGEVAARGTNTFTKNTADLGILRLDYHVVHNWDMMVEGRTANYKETGVTEYGALAGVYRHFGNNLKLGAGYQWGDVSNDLRSIEGGKEGVFLNIVGKF